MAAPQTVKDLVARFEHNRASYQSSGYNETQLRREFLDPLFKALGWDVDNEQGHAEAYKDVIHEDAIKVGGATKAPDYCFRVGGRRIFFLEAKKPSVNVAQDVNAAYQLRRYAWSAKLPLSILSDFEEFAVYDCRVKPNKTDKPAIARTLFLTFDQYVDKWDELAAVFSREAVLKGSFDKYAEGKKLKRGTAEVDAAFLEEIESWRKNLAQNLALRNKELDQRELNFAVQRIIDRIIFLRMCEDRGIESYGQLQGLVNGDRVYRRLCELFDRADERYNSGLFHFQVEKGRAEPPDELTPSLAIDDKVLKDMLRGLYYPDSPYEFSVLPAEILGQVYEQFLGKVIRLTPGHQAKIEDKPEVKKAGGVYYTPAYIVDYIVANTVGKLVEGRTPKEVAKFRVLDPACGSGSFLVGALQFLLDWHRDYYVEHGAGKQKEIYQGPGGQWFLTAAKKKEILLANIYGVDIDSQAVEVTKLSLLLKVLENENRETIERQLRLLHERALPDLGNNIKCGNSLIGPDFYDNKQLSLLDEDEQYRINAFDWKAEFAEIFKGKNGGFDAVIGNPPYVRMEVFQPIKEYLRRLYSSHQERADLYAYFLERGIAMLREGGVLGMIVSNKFIRAKYGLPLRAFLTSSTMIGTLADFAGARVFAGATVRTLILVARKRPCNGGSARYVPVPDPQTLDGFLTRRITVSDYAESHAVEMAPDALSGTEWNLGSAESAQLIAKLRSRSTPLDQYIGKPVAFGLKTGLNDAFVIDAETRARLLKRDKESVDMIRPILFGRDVRRYCIENQGRFVICIADADSLNRHTAIREQLIPWRKKLTERAGPQQWFELQQPAIAIRDRCAFPKIVYPIIAPECRFAMDIGGNLINDKLFMMDCDDYALIAVLNSRPANYYFSAVCAALEGATDRYLEFRAQYVDKFPVPTALRKASHERLAKLAQQSAKLHVAISDSRVPAEQQRLQRQIAATDRQIDQLVYELYGLTDKEIRLVEEATAATA